MLRTKSIHKPKSKADGLRICVMRRVRPEYDYDLWLPELAPSENLLAKYVINQQISWDQFRPLFFTELKRNLRVLLVICKIARLRNVSLLCAEETSTHCHRSLLAKICATFDEELSVCLD